MKKTLFLILCLVFVFGCQRIPKIAGLNLPEEYEIEPCFCCGNEDKQNNSKPMPRKSQKLTNESETQVESTVPKTPPAKKPPRKKQRNDHSNCELLSFPVSAHLMPSTTYTVPKHCFEPYVKHPDITVENQRRKHLLRIIGVMEERDTDQTGAQMLDFCWEEDWKWDHIDGPRPSHFPAVCAIPGLVTKEDIEIVKAIERGRLECLSQRKGGSR